MANVSSRAIPHKVCASIFRPRTLLWRRRRGALVRFLAGNFVLGSLHARFRALSYCLAGPADAFAHSLACGDWMSFLDVMSCCLGAASNVSRRGGHDLASTHPQMRERALVQCGCRLEALMLLILTDRPSSHRSHLSVRPSGLVTFLA